MVRKTSECPTSDNFEEWLAYLSQPLKRLAHRFGSRSSACDASDLYQEMVIFLWKSFEEGKFQNCKAGYLIKGCEFHLRNTLRKWTHHEVVSLEEPINEEGDTLKDCVADPVCLSRNLEVQLTIDEILSNGYSPMVKRVFALLLQGLTTREVGARVGVSHVRVVKLKQELIREYQKECNG
jgi:RNA polymerase sigma factor (sigma-70 family)